MIFANGMTSISQHCKRRPASLLHLLMLKTEQTLFCFYANVQHETMQKFCFIRISMSEPEQATSSRPRSGSPPYLTM